MIPPTQSVVLAAVFLAASQLATAPSDTERHTRKKPADPAELAAIAQRGQAIASYDAAAWHATDAVQALHPPPAAVEMYLGRQSASGWTIAFGRLNEGHDGFLLAFETQPTGDPLKPRVIVNRPALEDKGEWLAEARAYELARSQLRVDIPYNGAVLPGPDGRWYVYFYPAPTQADVWPTGADVRFLISHDGSTLLETHRMHLSVLTVDQRDAKAKGATAFHTAILDDAPEDTDVFNAVLIGVPMLVVGQKFAYEIDSSGHAKYAGSTAKIMPKE